MRHSTSVRIKISNKKTIRQPNGHHSEKINRAVHKQARLKTNFVSVILIFYSRCLYVGDTDVRSEAVPGSEE